jgi:hypothetical protein
MNITSITLTTLALLAWAIASDGDYQDALASEAAYCARVTSGEHGDYLQIREVCDERH